MYSLIRSCLFQLPAETSHHAALKGLRLANQLGLSSLVRADVPQTASTRVMGIDFPNKVGLAAGLDKDAAYIDGLAALGFGFIEVGTVTPLAQPGNPQPRIFRIPERRAVINRMGFNNHGIDNLIANVKAAQYRGILGINIGKNKDTPADKAADDYLICMRKAYDYASYITVNLSSPNTPGLRDLQFGEPLEQLLKVLKAEQQKLADQYGKYVPLAVKIAPDMDHSDIQSVSDSLRKYQLDGVIATNTTITRDGVEGCKNATEAGGLSGAPLTQKSTQVIQYLSTCLQGELPIIGVGGIVDGQSAADKIAAGASLVQIYSGFIYEGPGLVADAVKACQ
jgi:dihydroorotate dehydrogenase